MDNQKAKRTLSDEHKAKMLEGRRKNAENRKQQKELNKLEQKQELLNNKKLQIEAISQQKDRLKQERKCMDDRKKVKSKFQELRTQLQNKPEENKDNLIRIEEAIKNIEKEQAELYKPQDITKLLNELPKETPKELPKEIPKELPKETPKELFIKPVIKEYATQDQFKNIIDKISSTLPNDKAKSIFKNTVSSYNANESLDTNMSKLMEMAHNQIQRNSDEINNKIKQEEASEIIKQAEIDLLKKKERTAKLRAKARRYLYC